MSCSSDLSVVLTRSTGLMMLGLHAFRHSCADGCCGSAILICFTFFGVVLPPLFRRVEGFAFVVHRLRWGSASSCFLALAIDSFEDGFELITNVGFELSALLLFHLDQELHVVFSRRQARRRL